MAATVDTAPRADGAAALRERILSAAILLPLGFAVVWLGGAYWAALVCLFGMVMAWEWAGMAKGGEGSSRGPARGVGLAGMLSIGVVGVAVLLAAAGAYAAAVLVLLGGAALVAAGGEAMEGRGRRHGFGTLYVGLPSVAAIWLRAQPGNGLATVLWMLALVIAVDTGALAAGRSIGGPKLAPRISPNKTWAGLAGGSAGALVVGWIAALWLHPASLWPLILASGAMALVEQGGDLVESACKRRFGVKDSSRLIPGHGGVLDRVDGLLAVTLAAAAAELLGGGILEWTR